MPAPAQIIVQRVTTTWTKASRGGAGATARNQAPVAFRLPPGAAWHTVGMAEEDQFEPAHEAGAAVPEFVCEELGVRIDGGQLSMLPQVPASWMPGRHRRPPRQSVAPGAWLRWSVNYRLGLDRGWTYGLVTWNVAFRAQSCGRELFGGDPPHAVSELAALR